MSKLNKTCVICRELYEYCPSCKRDNDKPTWYNVFCSERCHDVYEICTSYRDGVYDKAQAYEKLSVCDLSGLNNFAESTKKQIEEIMNYKKEEVVEVKEEEEIIEETVEETVEEFPRMRPASFRKRK